YAPARRPRTPCLTHRSLSTSHTSPTPRQVDESLRAQPPRHRTNPCHFDRPDDLPALAIPHRLADPFRSEPGRHASPPPPCSQPHSTATCQICANRPRATNLGLS